MSPRTHFLAALALLFPCLSGAQTLDLGEGAKLHYQGNAGAVLWGFPAKGGKGQGYFAVQGLAEADFTLSFAPKVPVEIRLHPRLNFDPDRAYEGAWGLQLPPLWLDDAYFDWFTPRFELRAGYQVFSWKTVESVSQADILNQSDREADLFDPPKIGEASARARFILPTQAQNVLELYYLPFFTPSPLPATGSRYDFFQGTPHRLSQDLSTFRYLSRDEETRPQWAARYQTQLFESFDAALYYFHGYRRFPLFQPLSIRDGAQGDSILFTHLYPPLQQAGFTFQGALGSWLWKGETAFIRYEQDILGQSGRVVDPYLAYTAGFEYTFYSPIFQNQDLGAILELVGDSDAGKDQADLEGFRPFRSHVFAAFRYAFNTATDRSILAGAFLDYLQMDRIYRIEYAERFYGKLSFRTEFSGIFARNSSQFQPFEKAARFAAELKLHF